MYTATLRETDGSFSVDVPGQVVNHLSPGTTVSVSLQPQEPLAGLGSKRCSTEQLVREHAEIIDRLGDNRAWIDAPAVGRELI